MQPENTLIDSVVSWTVIRETETELELFRLISENVFISSGAIGGFVFRVSVKRGRSSTAMVHAGNVFP